MGCGYQLLKQDAFLKILLVICKHTYWFNSNLLIVAVHEVSSTCFQTYNLNKFSDLDKSNKIESDCSGNVFQLGKTLFVKRPSKKLSSRLAFSSCRCCTNHPTKINPIFLTKISYGWWLYIYFHVMGSTNRLPSQDPNSLVAALLYYHPAFLSPYWTHV